MSMALKRFFCNKPWFYELPLRRNGASQLGLNRVATTRINGTYNRPMPRISVLVAELLVIAGLGFIGFMLLVDDGERSAASGLAQSTGQSDVPAGELPGLPQIAGTDAPI